MKSNANVKSPQANNGSRRQKPQARSARAGKVGAGDDLYALQRFAGNQAVDALLDGGGQPLDSGLAAEMEALFGQDFHGVRLHTGRLSAEHAQDMAARAFTAGEHIVFGEGAYAPGTQAGKHLLAHELAHVVQQRAAAGQTLRGVSRPGDAYEQAAHAAAQQVTAGRPAGSMQPAGGTPPGANAALAAGGGSPPAVQRQEIADSAAKREEELRKMRDDFTSSIVNAFYSEPAMLDTAVLIDASKRLAEDLDDPPGPKTYYTNLRILVKAHQVLTERAASAPRRAGDNALMRDQWGFDLVPWAGNAKSVDEIPPFDPKNVALWKSVLSQENLGEEINQVAAGQAGAGKAAPSPQDPTLPPPPPPPPTLVGSVLRESTALPTEEQDPQAMKADVSRGVGILGGVTVQQAVQGIRDTLASGREKRGDPQEVIAYRNAENADLSLLKASGRIFYIGTYVYVLDRTGHIISTDFSFDGSTDMAPGGVYFFGNFALGTKGSQYSSNANILLRIDQGAPKPSGGDVYLGSILNAFIPLLTQHVEPSLKNNSGIAFVVSSSIGQRSEKSREINTDNILAAVNGAEYYMPWAVRTYGRNFIQNWDQALFSAAVGFGVGRLSKFIPVIGQAKMMYDLLLEEKWFLDMINVAGRAVSADEINLVSQALAWRVAEWAVGKAGGIIKKGVKKTIGTFGGVGQGKGGGAGTGKPPAPSAAGGGAKPAPAAAGTQTPGTPAKVPAAGGQVIPTPGSKTPQAGGVGAAKSAPVAPAGAAPPAAPSAAGAPPTAARAAPTVGGGEPAGAAPPAGNVVPLPARGPQAPAGSSGKAAPQPGTEGKVIPLRPKGKTEAPPSEAASQAAPQQVVRDATTGQPVQVVPLPAQGAAQGGAQPPVASAAGSGGPGGARPPASAAPSPAQGSTVQPAQPARPASAGAGGGGRKGGGGKGGDGGGEDQPPGATVHDINEARQKQAAKQPAAKPSEGEAGQQQPGEVHDLEAARQKRAQKTAKPAEGQAGQPAAKPAGAAPAIIPPANETPVQKARRETMAANPPVEKVNPPAKGTANRNLPDVRSRFQTTDTPRPDGGKVVSTAGELGEPGKVRSYRSKYQQSKVSKHTGDDAGHRIGSDFGGPEGTNNLARQNWVQNQGEGTFYALETSWKDKLRAGSRIHARVSDHYRPGENRPYKRTTEWTEIKPDGTVEHGELTFVNSASVKMRENETIYGPK